MKKAALFSAARLAAHMALRVIFVNPKRPLTAR
jgi:hypothetical protein